ncbi:alpha/beta fold hydrolase [Naasia aerilata]|uniref:alpha/beta fold hydrolase n=1 Tax=Naasia aerilata TaxID=1162966 RepID=UPI003305E80B
MSDATSSKPTIVLVHGSFADASGWSGVITRLAAKGYTSCAPANPLRDLAGDAAYIRSFLETIEGPIILVAHSYGGAVITNAATGLDSVKALVYINGFALAEGESVQTAGQLGSGPFLLVDHLVIRPFPNSGRATRTRTSTPPGSTTCSAPICPRSRLCTWGRPSAGLHSRPSEPRPASRPGRRSPPGISPRRATAPSRWRRSARWAGGPAARSGRSKRPTSR